MRTRIYDQATTMTVTIGLAATTSSILCITPKITPSIVRVREKACPALSTTPNSAASRLLPYSAALPRLVRQRLPMRNLPAQSLWQLLPFLIHRGLNVVVSLAEGACQSPFVSLQCFIAPDEHAHTLSLSLSLSSSFFFSSHVICHL
jgi:hypothetical protein